MTMTMNEKIGRHIRIMREARQMTMDDLAEQGQFARHRISWMEAGKGDLTLNELRRVAEVLDTTPGTLIDGPIRSRVVDVGGLDDATTTAIEVIINKLTRPGPGTAKDKAR